MKKNTDESESICFVFVFLFFFRLIWTLIYKLLLINFVVI